MEDTYIRVPLALLDLETEPKVKSWPLCTGIGQPYCIAALPINTGRRLLIKVSDLATREQLQAEVARMNARKDRKFNYTLSTEGKSI